MRSNMHIFYRTAQTQQQPTVLTRWSYTNALMLIAVVASWRFSCTVKYAAYSCMRLRVPGHNYHLLKWIMIELYLICTVHV